MSSYNRLALLKLLQEDIYLNKPIYSCGYTYDSIILVDPNEPLVPETVIIEKYPAYLLSHNLNILRRERNIRLLQSDIYGLFDYPFKSDDNKQAWITYRQSLRDITTVYPEPETDENDNLINVIFPNKPE
jgi:hypothetical protein